MEKTFNCCLSNIDQMQSFYLCISVFDITGTCTTEGLVLAQQQKFTLLPPFWVPWGFCGPWPWVYHGSSGRCLHQQFPQIKSSVLLSGSLMKLWGDMNPSRVLADYQMSAGPRATAVCPLSPVARLDSSGAGCDCPAHPPACSQQWCQKPQQSPGSSHLLLSTFPTASCLSPEGSCNCHPVTD